MDLLPDLGVACFPRALHSCLVLAEVDERRREPRPVGDACEEELCGLVQLVFETFLSNLKDIGDVCHAQKVLHVVQTVGLRISIGELGVDLGFAKRLASHLEEAHKIVMFASVVGDFDDFMEIRRVFRLNVRI